VRGKKKEKGKCEGKGERSEARGVNTKARKEENGSEKRRANEDK